MLLLLLFLVLFYFLARFFWEKLELSKLEKKPIFITGCDTGFGHGLALKCLQRGMPVFAGCLTEQGAENLKKETRNFSGKLETIIIDVSNDESVKKAQQFLEEKTKPYGGLHGLVNNAGVSGSSFADDFLTIEDYKKAAEVNIWGVIRVTHAVKDLIKKVKGRIIITTSVCGRIAIPFMGPYSVSKFAGEAYGDTIRKELNQWGVKVSIIEPGSFKTPILNKINLTKMIDSVWRKTTLKVKEDYGEEFVHSCQKILSGIETFGSDRIDFVVDAYFHALTAYFPRPRYHIGHDAVLLWIPLSILPTRIQDLLFNIGISLLGKPTPSVLKTS